MKVYATNYPTTDINDTAHVSMDSVPVLIDNFAPAYKSGEYYTLLCQFIYDSTGNEILLDYKQFSQYDVFRLYDNMKIRIQIAASEAINLKAFQS